MPNRPLTITTSAHAFAYVIYAELVLFGLLAATGNTQQQTFAVLPGSNIAMGAALVVGGLGGLFAIFQAQRKPNPQPAMSLELAMVITLAVANLFFLGLLWHSYGVGPRAASTAVYVGGTAVGCIVRAIQIIVDTRKLNAARANPLPASPILADPTTTTDNT